MKFIIPIIVGAIIGYITNWLAIKMLFRPHYEKRILGFKVPFTPGLIPKERFRMANSIGAAVGTHLLTSDMLVEALCSEKIKGHISTWVENQLFKTKESGATIKELLSRVVGDKYDFIVGRLEKVLVKLIMSQLQRADLREAALDILENSVLDKDSASSGSKLYDWIKNKVKTGMGKVANSEKFKENLSYFIQQKLGELGNDTKPLKDIIPQSIYESLKLFITNNSHEISGFIKESLENDEVRDKLKAIVIRMVEENLGKLVTMFISPDVIGNKVLDAVARYIDNPENQDNIGLLIINSVDRIMSKSASEVISGMSSQTRNTASTELTEILIKYVKKEENLNYIFKVIEDNIKMSEENFNRILLSNIRELITELMDIENGEEIVSSIIHNIIVSSFMNMEIGSIIEIVGIPTSDKLLKHTGNIYEGFIKGNVGQILGLIDISSIVEERINGFEVAFAEEIILEVASRELKAITWLGALLGGIMGVMSPLLETLTR